MDSQPGQPVAVYLTFAAVQPHPDLDAQRSHRLDNGLSTSNCPGRAVKRCHKAIASPIDLSAVEDVKLITDEVIVSVQ